MSKLQLEIVFNLHLRAGWAQIVQLLASSAVHSELWVCFYMLCMWNVFNSKHDPKVIYNPSPRTSPWAWIIFVACVFSERLIIFLNHKENQNILIKKFSETMKDSYINKQKRWKSALEVTLSNAVWTIKLFHLVCVCVCVEVGKGGTGKTSRITSPTEKCCSINWVVDAETGKLLTFFRLS